MKRVSDKRIFILLCCNAFFYITIVTLDIINAGVGVTATQGLVCDAFKYLAIISCLLICLFARSHTRRKVARIQAIVFCFTLAADFFLLFTPYFLTGVLCFLGAHTCALIRYKPKWILPAGICAAAFFAATLRLAPRLLHIEPRLALIAAACVAYTVLITSVTVSTFHSPQPRENTIFSRLGMILFLACDINVAIFNTLPTGSAPHTASIVLMWFFYLPAQTLLALSAVDLPLFPRFCKQKLKPEVMGYKADETRSTNRAE